MGVACVVVAGALAMALVPRAGAYGGPGWRARGSREKMWARALESGDRAAMSPTDGAWHDIMTALEVSGVTVETLSEDPPIVAVPKFLSKALREQLKGVYNRAIVEEEDAAPLWCFNKHQFHILEAAGIPIPAHFTDEGADAPGGPLDVDDKGRPKMPRNPRRLVNGEPPKSHEHCLDDPVEVALLEPYHHIATHAIVVEPGERTEVDNAEVQAFRKAGLSGAMGFPHELVKYEEGQSYDTHSDCMDLPRVRSPIVPQRAFSMIVYLNDVAVGGETVFPDVKGPDGTELRVRPEAGKALLWNNMATDGACSPLVEHYAAPVGAGNIEPKYIWQRFYDAKPVSAGDLGPNPSINRNRMWCTKDTCRHQLQSASFRHSLSIMRGVLHADTEAGRKLLDSWRDGTLDPDIARELHSAGDNGRMITDVVRRYGPLHNWNDTVVEMLVEAAEAAEQLPFAALLAVRVGVQRLGGATRELTVDVTQEDVDAVRALFERVVPLLSNYAERMEKLRQRADDKAVRPAVAEALSAIRRAETAVTRAQKEVDGATEL